MINILMFMVNLDIDKGGVIMIDEEIKNRVTTIFSKYDIYNFEDLENRLKVLKIIREKRVDVSMLIKTFFFIIFQRRTKDMYNDAACKDKSDTFGSLELTQAEYDLLYKVLL